MSDKSNKNGKNNKKEDFGKITLVRLKRYLSLYQKKAGAYWLMQFLNPALSSVTNMLEAFLYRDVINAVSLGSFDLLMSAVYLAAAVFLVNLVSTWTGYLHMYYTRHIVQDLQIRVFSHLQSLPMTYFDAHHTAESIQKVCTETNHMKTPLAQYHSWFLHTTLRGAFAIVFILFLDWRLGLISIAIGAIALQVNLRLTKPLHGMAQKIQKTLETCTARLTDLLAGMRVIHMFPGARRMLDMYEEANEDVAGQTVRRYGLMGTVSAVGGMFAFISSIGMLLVGILMVRANQVNLGTVMAVSSMQDSVSWFLGSIGSVWGRIKESIVLGERVLQVLDEPKEPQKYATPCENSATGLVFDNASFSYDGVRQILSGISLEVREGKTVALVGASGGGKSTIIKLLLGFYQLTGGGAGVLGKAVGDYTLRELRGKIAYVPQDAYLFAGSIRENIRNGRADATDDEIISAAKRAFAHDFIMTLPEGYDTQVGERGDSISGGQRQRIAIARAFVKDAPVLLLDEATSALDNESEQLVQKGIEALMEGRTTLVVAHRLSTIEKADWIYVLENGSVREEGTHENLMKTSGVYSGLVNRGKTAEAGA